jgi:hypothetical protein
LLAYPPRLSPHPDYDMDVAPVEAAPQGPADPVDVVREGPTSPAVKDQPSSGLAPIATPVGRRPSEEIAPELPSAPGPSSTPHDDGRAALVRGPVRRPPTGPDSSSAEPLQAQRACPADCPYPRHQQSWVQRPDGTWRCRTCHP